MPDIRAVVFDIGNVLVEWHPERTFDALIGEERRRALFANVDLETMNKRVDLGEEIADVVAETAGKHPEYHDEILLWHTRWVDMVAPVIPESIAMLRALRTNGVPVFALSNFGTSTLDLADTIYPALTEFDQRFISGHLRVMKPDPAIYEVVERETGLDPTTLLFTDDKAENTQAASKRGWQTHLFEGPGGLLDRLVSEGLLRREDLIA